MKTRVLLGIMAVFLLSSCVWNNTEKKEISTPLPTPTGSAVPDVSYPTSQSDTPATQFCVNHGGKISIEKSDTGSMDVAYCTLPEGNKIDAWKFMNESTEK